MLKFAEFITEAIAGGLTKNEAGKLHEVLVGGLVNHYAKEYQKYKHMGHEFAHETAMRAIQAPSRITNSHMYNIAHMPQFRDADNKTAKQLHDEISSNLNQKDYDEHFQHALHGATHLINHLQDNGITDLKRVHFTANPKDIERLTNKIEKGNNSDIVVEHGTKSGEPGFSGVSLKSGENSKLNNPGMDKFAKNVDDYYEAITGKKGTFSKDALNAEINAKAAHLKIFKDPQVNDFLHRHFGEKGITAPGKISYDSDGNTILHPDAFRYLEKADSKKEKHRNLYANEDDRKKFNEIYNRLRDSRTDLAKRPTNESFGRHLSEIMSHQADPSKRELIRSFLKYTTNLGRDKGSMPVVRMNTWKNTDAAVRKGAPPRQSSISTAENDFDNHYDRSYGGYRVKSSPGTISTDLVGPSGHVLNFVMDSSPAGGGSMVNRRGVHVWDKSKEIEPGEQQPATKPKPVQKPTPMQIAAARKQTQTQTRTTAPASQARTVSRNKSTQRTNFGVAGDNPDSPMHAWRGSHDSSIGNKEFRDPL